MTMESQPRQGLDIFALRDLFNRERIMLCFNGPVTATLIEEIGTALRNYMEKLAESASSVSDVFSVYIEITQNIRRYASSRPELALESAHILVSRNEEGRYIVSAGNVVETADGEVLRQRIAELAAMDKVALKAAFKEQIRRPRSELEGSAGLGLIDMARKATHPLWCELLPLDHRRALFQLRVIL
ncbi:biofilm regulation protein kinase SiaB [Blastochloris tepida]|jgi:hypothetical protein|uniref:Uncharacterized protein n=1 Tax=Blastochloris tepida TaxID=2233851 RepID=A0A348G0B3_9HYPH|nr:biofilm regulation protein kinase SiaB [Blastochloris tepida]BBF92996.1 hypothetical protein BLTE_16810 [Blastochloris tepida]